MIEMGSWDQEEEETRVKRPETSVRVARALFYPRNIHGTLDQIPRRPPGVCFLVCTMSIFHNLG